MISRISILATVGILLAGCNTTGMVATKHVVSGKQIQLTHLTSLNADCTSVGETVVRVITQPSNGTISVQRGTSYSSYAQSNQRYHCNTMKTPGTQVLYTSKAGFVGSDSVAIDVIFPSGHTWRGTYNITVN